jgi:hypothetical protein
MTEISQKPRRGKGAIVLIAAAVVFLMAAGAFGTLWILERDDHRATTEQLTGPRAQAAEAKTKLREAEDKRKAIGDKLQDTVTRERTLDITLDKFMNCADAGLKWANAVRARDEAAQSEPRSRISHWCTV